jgi:hypothetical protein
MRNILTAILGTIAIGIIVSATIGIFIIGKTELVENNLVVEDEHASFTYELGCFSMTSFGKRMLEYEGTLLSTGPTSAGSISVISFPDGSFAVFLYRPENRAVCAVSTGTFSPGDPV